MKSCKYKIKPLDNVHFFFLLLALIVFLPFDIALFSGSNETMFLICVIIMNAVPIVAFILTRAFYNKKYIVNEDFFIKYSGKKIVFKIKISDIEMIFVRKGKWYAFPHFLFESLVTSSYQDCRASCCSLVFNRCDVMQKEKNEFLRPELKTEKYKMCFEISEILSYSKIKRLCKKLNVTPKYV